MSEQFHDDLDGLYGSDPYLWEQNIEIASADCICMYPYAKCWENNSESFMEGCAEDVSDSQDLYVDSMSKWKKARIDEVQVELLIHWWL